MRLMAAIAIPALLLASAAHAVDEGDSAPPWKGVDFGGSDVEFPAVLDGRPAVVVFWATWCGYCKAFFPYLEEIQAEYGTERINVLLINAMEDGEVDPGAYVAALDFPLVAVRNGDAIAAAYGVEYIPEIMVVDAEGSVAYRRDFTELPAGRAVASLWSSQVRSALGRLLHE